jgi:hypothetical protein
VRARLLPEMNTEHAWKGDVRVHWSYRFLRRFALTALVVLFWVWVIVLALSGKF